MGAGAGAAECDILPEVLQLARPGAPRAGWVIHPGVSPRTHHCPHILLLIEQTAVEACIKHLLYTQLPQCLGWTHSRPSTNTWLKTMVKPVKPRCQVPLDQPGKPRPSLCPAFPVPTLSSSLQLLTSQEEGRAD